jgi:hypothetical protein
VKYELGFYIPEDDILHSHRLENLKSYILIPCSSLNISDQVTPPYRTTTKIIALCSQFLCFLKADGRTKCSEPSGGPNGSKHYQNSFFSSLPHDSNCDCHCPSQIFELSYIFKNFYVRIFSLLSADEIATYT